MLLRHVAGGREDLGLFTSHSLVHAHDRPLWFLRPIVQRCALHHMSRLRFFPSFGAHLSCLRCFPQTGSQQNHVLPPPGLDFVAVLNSPLHHICCCLLPGVLPLSLCEFGYHCWPASLARVMFNTADLFGHSMLSCRSWLWQFKPTR